MKKILKLIIIVFSILTICKNTFCLNMTTLGLDEELLNTYLAEDESMNEDILEVVYFFNKNFITPEMNDLQKEIQIIKFLVETVDFDVDEKGYEVFRINNSFKAYGALIEKKAVCSGYAKAFDLLCKYNDLQTTIVTGQAIANGNKENHAWNQICLDGKWYNVDVTWEDPITNIKLGFDDLLNEYINLTDEEMGKDHIRETGHYCEATTYGHKVVEYYLHTGVVDVNADLDVLRNFYEMQIEKSAQNNDVEVMEKLLSKYVNLGARYNNSINYVLDNNDYYITQYILNCLNSNKNVISIVTDSDTENMFSIDKDNWLDLYINKNVSCKLYKYFYTDGRIDTRVLIFLWG